MKILFFPEQAQGDHSRKLSENVSFSHLRRRYEESLRARRQEEVDRRLQFLEDEVGFLILMLEAVVRRSEEKGGVTREELKAMMSIIDREDGEHRPE